MPGGDTVVALLGIVMAAALLSRSSGVRNLPPRRKLLYATVWIGIFAGGVLLVTLLQDQI